MKSQRLWRVPYATSRSPGLTFSFLLHGLASTSRTPPQCQKTGPSQTVSCSWTALFSWTVSPSRTTSASRPPILTRTTSAFRRVTPKSDSVLDNFCSRTASPSRTASVSQTSNSISVLDSFCLSNSVFGSDSFFLSNSVFTSLWRSPTVFYSPFAPHHWIDLDDTDPSDGAKRAAAVNNIVAQSESGDNGLRTAMLGIAATG